MALSKKDVHIGRFFQEAKSRAKNKNVPFTVTLKYLRETAGDHCPVFGHKFIWGRSRLGKGKTTGNSPSLDRIVPELGYVPENVVFISHNANRIKNNATEKELYAVADWLHKARKKVNAQTNTTTPVPAGDNRESEVSTKHGTIPAAGSREDHYDLDHYCRTVQGEDSDYRTQTRGGDSVGHGGKEVGTPQASQSQQNHGNTKPKISSIKFGGRHLFS